MLLDAEGAGRFGVGLRLGLAARGALALALARRLCMPRVRPCLALIKLGGPSAIRRYTVHFLLKVKRDVALHVAFGQAPERLGGRVRGPLGLLLPGLSGSLSESELLLESVDLLLELESAGGGAVCVGGV